MQNYLTHNIITITDPDVVFILRFPMRYLNKIHMS
jgi:hypothetical protein